MTDFNTGQLSRNERQRRALMRKIEVAEPHWMWTGDVNQSGWPILCLGGDYVSAALAVYEAFEGPRRGVDLVRCHRRRCVRPNCHRHDA